MSDVTTSTDGNGGSAEAADGEEPPDLATLIARGDLEGLDAALAAGADPNRGDRWGNLTYRGTQANFGPVMATAAAVTIAEVRQVVADGAIDPHHVRTSGIYVDRMVAVPEEG